MLLTAGLAGKPAPAFEDFQKVWDVWNSKSPEQQAADGLASDAAFLDLVDGLSPDRRAAFQMELFGSRQDLSGVVRMRLGEHVVHTWDVMVAVDPKATLPGDAVSLLIDGLGLIVQRSGKESATPCRSHRGDRQPESPFPAGSGPRGGTPVRGTPGRRDVSDATDASRGLHPLGLQPTRSRPYPAGHRRPGPAGRTSGSVARDLTPVGGAREGGIWKLRYKM